MEIWHLGHSCFKIKGRQATLITDPFSPEMVGLKFPNVEADIVTVSHEHNDHNMTHLVGGNPIVIKGPGEYEIKGVKILGLQSFHDTKGGQEKGENTIFQIVIDGLHLLHLGDLGQKLEADKIAKIATPDVLFIPTGGTFTISAKTAAEIIAQFEPSLVIPMHYLDEKSKSSNLPQLTPVDDFLKILGKENITPQPKLTISKEKIPQEMQVIVLS